MYNIFADFITKPATNCEIHLGTNIYLKINDWPSSDIVDTSENSDISENIGQTFLTQLGFKYRNR